jgi:hypothetical protein
MMIVFPGGKSAGLKVKWIGVPELVPRDSAPQPLIQASGFGDGFPLTSRLVRKCLLPSA